MARKHEAADLLLAGNPPSRIAQLMGISYASVSAYLCTQIGEGRITRYQILQSMDRQARDVVESVLENAAFSSQNEFFRAAYKALGAAKLQFPGEDLVTYLRFRDAALADMYELIRKIELNLHSTVKKALVDKFGPETWWRKGIPENIRAECAAAREKDAEPARDPYCYTTLIQLKETYEKRWGTLAESLPEKIRADKQNFLASLTRLNRIRNAVMHPVKGKRLCDDDFSFVREFKTSLNVPF